MSAKYCMSCVVCGTGNGGSFTHHSHYVSPGVHVSVNKNCSITGMHCIRCCKERE